MSVSRADPDVVNVLAKRGGTSLRDATPETWEDHVEAWHAFGRLEDESRWGRAAVVVSLKGRYGEDAFEKFGDEVGQARSTLYQFASVHETFVEKSKRLDNLSFLHHLVALAADDPFAALDKAAEEGWSARDLRKHLKESKSLAPAPPLPAGVYSTLVIDPPWQIEKIDRDVRPKQAAVDYPMMSLEELAALPVASKAAPDAHLYLWTTHKYLPAALSLAETWGFHYQCLMTWVKNVGMTPFSWMYSTEHVLFCRRGSLDLLRKGMRLDFSAKVTKHSEKPDAFYELVRQASPEPRLEFFARKASKGFTVWGNEAPVEEEVA